MAIVTLLNERTRREGDISIDRLRYIIISESDDDERRLARSDGSALERSGNNFVVSAKEVDKSDLTRQHFVSLYDCEGPNERVLHNNNQH